MNKILFLLVFILVAIGAFMTYEKKSKVRLVSGIAEYMINQECQRQISQPVIKQVTESIDVPDVSKQYCNCIAVHASRKLHVKEIVQMINSQNRQQKVSKFSASFATVCRQSLQRY